MRMIAIAVAALLACIAGAEAASLPGQASRFCTIPSAVEIDGAKKSDASPYLGIFDGRWDGVLPVTLVVYDVRGNKAYGYYAWKDYGPWNVSAGCRAVLGRIVGGKLNFRGDDTMTFVTKGARLEGTYVYKPGGSDEFIEHGTFSRRR